MSNTLVPFAFSAKNIFITQYKLLLTLIYEYSCQARAFVPGSPFQPSLMFVGQAWSLARERYSTRVCSRLTRKHQTRLERLSTDENQSLLGKLSNYGHKMFYKYAPITKCYKTFYGRNFATSKDVCPQQAFLVKMFMSQTQVKRRGYLNLRTKKFYDIGPRSGGKSA